MQLNNDPTSLATRPARLPDGKLIGYFAQGNPANLVPWTIVTADLLNDYIDEMRNLLAFAGLAPSSADQGQMLKAVQHLLFQPRILGGFASITQRDGAGNGGLLMLSGSKGGASYADIDLDNYQGRFRIFTNGLNAGLVYDPAGFSLNVYTTVAGQPGFVGRVSAATFVSYPDVNGNRVVYFGDANGQQTGHILQAADNSIHINSGAQELEFDTTGNLTVSGVVTGASANFNTGSVDAGSFMTVPNGSVTAGTNGVATTGSMFATGNVTAQANLQGAGVQIDGNNITMTNPGTFTAPAGTFPNLQVVYNNTAGSFEAGVPQAELWCKGAILAVNSNGGVFAKTQGITQKTIVADQSARALKRQIRPVEDALAVVRAVPTYSYRYRKGTGLDPAPVHVGHMYEDLVLHAPQATQVVDGQKQVMHHKQVPYLWRAVQQLADANDALHARLDAIEAAPGALPT